MLDKRKILNKITKNKNFKITINKPFNELNTKFLIDFSNELKKDKNIYKFPELFYLMFWCTKKNINKLKSNHLSKKIRFGRGLAYHICPSNVPTNFIYSFFFGLLSGNSNIVKLPNKNFPEKELILNIFKNLIKKKKYKIIKNSNSFIEYDKNNEYTKDISSICDARIIWGGNKTINEVRKFWIPERSIELTFADRYSLSIININEITKKNNDELTIIIKKFFYDSYSMNQAACNSPHFIFWIGKKNVKFQNKFWSKLNDFTNKHYSLDEKGAVDKYSNLISNIFMQKKFDGVKIFKNNLYVIRPNKNLDQIENIRGIHGTFFEKNIVDISYLKKFITKKCQTITYFGIKKKVIENFLNNSNLLGVDRIVPIGKGLEIDTVWDGYDTINSLSRIINLE